MSLHDLPPETVDNIVRLLGNDHLALDACSLVGWLFLPSCRYVTFSTIRIGYGELSAFLDAIDSPLSTIAPALREIYFQQKPERLGYFDGGKPIPAVSRGTMAMLENNIRYVQLEGIPPRDMDGFWDFMVELKSVREVEIESGIFEMMAIGTSDVALGWVCGLSELSILSVVRSPPSLMKAAPLQRQKPVLPSWTALAGGGVKARNAEGVKVSLDVRGWDQLAVVRWMMIQKPMPCVRTLRIGSSQMGFWTGGSACDVHLLKDFVAKVGCGLEELSILLPEDAKMDALDSLDLSPCINLRTIHISGFLISPSHRAQRMALEMLLEKITDSVYGPYLRNITLTIEIDPRVRNMLAYLGISDFVLFERLDWGRIPEILGKITQGAGGIDSITQKVGLTLIVQRCFWYYHKGIEQVLRREIFSELQERGGLSVQFDGGEHL